jgi:Ca2+-binding EF-hand superfamily protein
LSAASDLPPDDAIKYARRYEIGPTELRYIFRRFRVLCKTNGRTLLPSDVSRTASLLRHQLSKRVINVMAGLSKGGGVNFENFLQTYKKFRPGQPLEAKLRFVFDIFDQDSDGRRATHPAFLNALML